MDYIPLPAEPVGPRRRVPYLGQFIYDSRGFIDYPLRVGIVITPNSLHRNSLFLVRNGELMHAGAFIQAWLWFGLIGEALGAGFQPNGQFLSLKPSVFLRRHDNTDYLCTEHLVSMLERGKERLAANDERIDDLAKCLEAARVYLERVSRDLRTLRNNNVLYHNRKEEIETLTTVIMSCCLLWQTVYNVYEVRSHPMVGVAGNSQSMTHHPPFSLVDDILREAGWKDREIHRMPLDVTLRYHLNLYRGNRGLMGHTKLLPASAIAVYRHTKHDCVCHAHAFTMSRSTTDNSVTLFRHDPNNTLSGNALHSEVVLLDDYNHRKPYQATPYVAVLLIQPAAEPRGWLPVGPIQTCKLEMIQKYTNKLLGPFSPLDAIHHFWIDPCALSANPGTPPSPFQYLNVVSQASYVLVIDPWLYENTAPQCSNSEKLIRIRWSNWKESTPGLLQSAQVEPSRLFFLLDVQDGTTHDGILASMDSLLKGVSQENQTQTTATTASGPHTITTQTPPSPLELTGPQTATALQQNAMLVPSGPLSATLPAKIVDYEIVVPSRTPTPDIQCILFPTAPQPPLEPNSIIEKKTLLMLRPSQPPLGPHLLQAADNFLKTIFIPRFQKDLATLFRYTMTHGPDARFGVDPRSNPQLQALINQLMVVLRVAVLTLLHFWIFMERIGAVAVAVVFRALTKVYGKLYGGHDFEHVLARLKRMGVRWAQRPVR